MKSEKSELMKLVDSYYRHGDEKRRPFINLERMYAHKTHQNFSASVRARFLGVFDGTFVWASTCWTFHPDWTPPQTVYQGLHLWIQHYSFPRKGRIYRGGMRQSALRSRVKKYLAFHNSTKEQAK